MSNRLASERDFKSLLRSIDEYVKYDYIESEALLDVGFRVETMEDGTQLILTRSLLDFDI